jgi:fatty acid desaturase
VTVTSAAPGRQSPASKTKAIKSSGLLDAEQIRDLATLRRKDVAKNIAYLSLTWLIIAAAFTVAGEWTRWWVVVLAFLVTSSRQQALLNMEHECIHSSFTRNKTRDKAIGIIACASPAGSPWHDSRARHLTHHRTLTTADDPDLPLHDTVGKSTRGSLVRYFGLGLFGGYAAMILLSGAPSAVGRQDKLRDFRNLAITQLVLWGASWLAFGEWWLYLAIWVLPLITLTTVSHLIRSFIEHAVLTEERPEHDNLLVSITSNPLELAFIAPYKMNYHAEHHMFPAVPAFRLPEVRTALEDSPEPPRLLRTAYLTQLVRYAKSLSAT